MDIVFCINTSYAKYVAVSLCSIFENNLKEKIHIHILTDGLLPNDEKLLTDIIERYGGKYSKHLVDDSRLKELKSTWSVYSWYRCYIPEFLPNTSRCLYLDADVIVTGNIQELFTLRMNQKAIAAVIDTESYNPQVFKRLQYPQQKKYICSGIMIMNLDYWREHNITEQILNYANLNHNRIAFPDQDSINVVCQDTKIILPLKFGILNTFVTNNEFIKDNISSLKEMLSDPRIIHYAGFAPWVIEKNRHFMRNDFKYYNHLAGNPAKSKHILSGMKLVNFKMRRILTKIGLLNFKPYFCTPILSYNDIQSKLESFDNKNNII